jgi:ABC-type uncharacterized transport system fused permease/ATPase subunit
LGLTGTSLKHVLHQDKAAFIRLTGISVLQSVASAIVAPSLRNLTAKLALGWRYRLTESLSKLYFQNNAYYKVRWSQIAAFRDYIVIGPYLLTTGSPLSLPAAYECDQQVVK